VLPWVVVTKMIFRSIDEYTDHSIFR